LHRPPPITRLKKCGAQRLGFFFNSFFELKTPQTLFSPNLKKIEDHQQSTLSQNKIEQ
jgi:hypothetical protein